MNSNTDEILIDWSEAIVIFNSLIKNIKTLRHAIDSDTLDDDDLYEAEEELNDYVTLLTRLRQRYNDIPDKGELPDTMLKTLNEIC